MAKRTTQLVKIDDSLRLLFVEGGALGPSRVNAHAHPHWQLERIGGPDVTLLERDGSRSLSAGDTLLIPPGAVHGFVYAQRTEVASYKFELRGDVFRATGVNPCVVRTGKTHGFTPVALQIARADPLDALFRAAAALHAKPTPADPLVLVSLERVLGAIVKRCRAGTTRETTLADRVAAYVAQHRDRDLRVTEIASALGYSASHLSAIFRIERKESLKRHIDHARASLAVEQLRYSDRPVGEIARGVGFADPYTFSRFVRRLTGAPPSHHRRKSLS